MAKRNWTPEQKLAIDTEGRTLLVSAAAGSGKTAVLTERIIERLIDAENPIDITDMLVVTFTNAAVGELRERITDAVKAKVKENPKSERLRRQLLLLPGAKICTIDSFCGDILRANCDAVGVSPAYRIADRVEAELLAESILDSLIDGVYLGQEKNLVSAQDLDRLAECLTDTKEQGTISSVIRYLYEGTRRSVEGIGSLRRLAELYNPDNLSSGVNSTPYARYIADRAREMAEHYISVIEKTKEELYSFSGSERIIEVLCSDLAFLRRALSAEGYTGLYGIFSDFSFPKSPNKLKDPAAPNTTDMRAELKADLEGFKSRYMYYAEDTWRVAYTEIYGLLTTLVKLVFEFDRRFLCEKVRRGALEYSDVTRFTYECLVKEGKPTELALSEKNKYEAIFIDEYQDVDSLQDAIFRAISREDNRFMVGDIKQSIYGFRGAEPTLFAKMKNSFAPLLPTDIQEGKEPRTIFMSDNFRCDRGVIDFVNGIFDTVFSLDKESVGYTASDRLNFAKVYEGDAPAEVIKPEICVIDKNYQPYEDTPSDMSQPYLVAGKIKKLLEGERLNSGEPIRPKDIAIILRSAKDRAVNYAEALSLLGIPSSADDDKDFFLNREVLLALCLLNAIDNPEREIYLAGLMLSPLYNFTADDMVRIKKTGEDGLYSCLKKYTEDNPDFEKGERFLSSLARYRAIAEGMSVDKLLSRLYAETGLLYLASKNGGKEHLLLLYSYAKDFEASSFKGLYNFIGYINRLIERGSTFENKKGAGDEDAVRIITVHSSKGLEYPVVFFAAAECDTVKKENDKKRFLYKEDFGIGIYYRDPSGLALVRNPMREAIKDAIAREEFREAERVLYVALTRARERLYITAKSRGYAENLIEKCIERREKLSRYSLYSCSSFIELILSATPKTVLDASSFVGGALGKNRTDAAGRVEKTEGSDYAEGEIKEALEERFAFKYADGFFTDLPEKLSVSNLYPTVLDGADENTVKLFDEEEYVNKTRHFVAPAFITGEDSDISVKRGIATHKMLQFCDFSNLEKEGVDAEIRRLLAEGFLSSSDEPLIRRSEVELFRSSRLLGEILGARRLWRELRFNLRLPAANFTADPERKRAYLERGETVLVQGVIDCLIEDTEGNLHLVDYKTDRLTERELGNKALAEEKLSRLHSGQLAYYADAVKAVFGRAPSTVRVYSLPLGDTVDLG